MLPTWMGGIPNGGASGMAAGELGTPYGESFSSGHPPMMQPPPTRVDGVPGGMMPAVSPHMPQAPVMMNHPGIMPVRGRVR